MVFSLPINRQQKKTELFSSNCAATETFFSQHNKENAINNKIEWKEGKKTESLVQNEDRLDIWIGRCASGHGSYINKKN